MPSSRSKPPQKPSLAVVPAPTRPRDRLQLTSFPIHPFDQAHGVDTSGLVPAKHLVTGHANDEHVTAYYGVAPSILRALIREWRETIPPHPISSYTFLDIGSGKGRGLLVASEYRFRKVIGIELHPALATVARQNVAHWTASRSADPTSEPPRPYRDRRRRCARLPPPQHAGPSLPHPPVRGARAPPAAAPYRDAIRRPPPSGPRQIRLRSPGWKPLASPLDLIYVNAECANVLDRNPAFSQIFLDNVKMTPEDHAADLEAIARQKEYGSTGDEECAIYRYTGRAKGPIFTPAA